MVFLSRICIKAIAAPARTLDSQPETLNPNCRVPGSGVDSPTCLVGCVRRRVITWETQLILVIPFITHINPINPIDPRSPDY